ncbi:MAG: hypothetical protein OEY44_02715, partial [Candidatus Peregrinibacteria bacterium]|nr:hypothetical protein [Candidatus Peregrinibacteria bacterium]
MKPIARLITASSIILLSAGVSMAATDITGDIMSEHFGLTQMQETGGGVTIEDINTADNCDNTRQICYLEGYSWSDVVGWTVWDGQLIQNEIGAAQFPDSFFAKVNYSGGVEGFVWSEKIGWIQLSSCTSKSSIECAAASYCSWNGSYCELSKGGRPPAAASQNLTDWGAYIDFCPLKLSSAACTDALSDPYCNWDATDSICIFDSGINPAGQPLRGFIFSENLNWIKMGLGLSDSGFAGAFTTWFPDLTPPTLEAVNGAWIPNDSASGTISWPGFAEENDSSIDLARSSIEVVTAPDPAYIGCPLATAQTNGNVILDQLITGEVNVSIPSIGLIGAPLLGHCKFTLEGALYNGSGFAYYFGTEGANMAATDGVNLAGPEPNVYSADPITLFVRAGDYYAPNSTLSTDGPAVADGIDIITAQFAPNDIGGNPIIPVPVNLDAFPTAISAIWVRNIPIQYDYSQTSDYVFDRINYNRNIIGTYPYPIVIASNIYGFTDNLTYPLAAPSTQPHNLGTYSLEAKGYAPTIAVGNTLVLDQILLNQVDVELPAISSLAGPLDTSQNLVLNSGLSPAGLPYAYNFTPALEVLDGQLDAEFIVIGQPVQATYSIQNSSSELLDGYAVDHLVNFTNIDPGIGSQILEIKDINLSTLNDTTG